MIYACIKAVYIQVTNIIIACYELCNLSVCCMGSFALNAGVRVVISAAAPYRLADVYYSVVQEPVGKRPRYKCRAWLRFVDVLYCIFAVGVRFIYKHIVQQLAVVRQVLFVFSKLVIAPLSSESQLYSFVDIFVRTNLRPQVPVSLHFVVLLKKKAAICQYINK